MPDPRFQDQFAGAVRVQQIIVMAMAVGCLAFAAIVVAISPQGGQAPAEPGLPLVTCIALAVVVAAMIMFFAARVVVAGQARRAALALAEQHAEGARDASSADDLLQSADVVRTLLQGFQTRLIVGAALLEGPAFFLLIAYLTEGNPLALGAAIALTMGILLQFPTRSRVAVWILRQAELIHHQRQFSRR